MNRELRGHEESRVECTPIFEPEYPYCNDGNNWNKDVVADSRIYWKVEEYTEMVDVVVVVLVAAWTLNVTGVLDTWLYWLLWSVQLAVPETVHDPRLVGFSDSIALKFVQ